MSTRTLFLIPARGGSKRIPGKNLINLAGIPLVGLVRTQSLSGALLTGLALLLLLDLQARHQEATSSVSRSVVISRSERRATIRPRLEAKS